MYRLCISLFGVMLAVGTVTATPAAQIDKSQVIVYINGAKYYVHTVKPGETLYSISKAYGVDEKSIISHNPSAADGLKVDQTIKIPVQSIVTTEEKSPARKKRRDYEIHTVEAGETLYSISRLYAISVDTILADNGDIDPSHMPLGTRLYIRKSEIGTASDKQVRDEMEEYRDNMNAVAPEGYSYYLVQAGDTLYSLCRRFAISEEALRSLNPMPEGLKAGSIIKVPVEQQPEKHQEHDVWPGYGDDSQTIYGGTSVFKAVNGNRALNVALLLPMTRQGEAVNHYMDFYRGFLLGLERVKADGKSVNLTLFDTEQNASKVSEIVADGFGGMHPDLIVGPVYENLMAPVVSYAERHDIPMVSPLATLSSTDSNVVFQLSPDMKARYDKVADLFNGSRKVTLIYSETVDKEFESEVLALLAGRSYETHKYVYEHPSVIEQREKERERLGISSDEAVSPSDMSPLLRGDESKVFIILADNETDVDRILTAIASANISLTARSRTVSHFVVLGNSKWNRYANIDRSIFFQDRVIMLTSYNARRENQTIKDFDSRYVAAFGSIPSLYSYRGYDAAVLFGNGMFSDIRFGMEGRRYMPLQTPYNFRRDNGMQTRVNSEWVRLDYNNDYTITAR